MAIFLDPDYAPGILLLCLAPTASSLCPCLGTVASCAEWLSSLATLTCVQTRCRRSDLLELSHFIPRFRFAGSFSTSGTSGGVAFLASATFAEEYPDRHMIEVVRGRIASLRCRGSGVPLTDITSVHLVDIPRWHRRRSSRDSPRTGNLSIVASLLCLAKFASWRQVTADSTLRQGCMPTTTPR